MRPTRCATTSRQRERVSPRQGRGRTAGRIPVSVLNPTRDRPVNHEAFRTRLPPDLKRIIDPAGQPARGLHPAPARKPLRRTDAQPSEEELRSTVDRRAAGVRRAVLTAPVGAGRPGKPAGHVGPAARVCDRHTGASTRRSSSSSPARPSSSHDLAASASRRDGLRYGSLGGRPEPLVCWDPSSGTSSTGRRR